MERPTTEVSLPISGMKAVVYTYYTRGERKAIEAIMLESAVFKQGEDGTPKLEKVDTSYRSQMEDKAVLLAVKEFVKDEEIIKPSVVILDNLPDDDFLALTEALPKSELKKK